jgi:hypothetical protein
MKAACGVAAALAALTAAMTWPLGARLASSVPGSYGEPLQAMWAMGWVMNALTVAMRHPSTLGGFWNANIFFPEPRALAFSEPHIGQAVIALPIHWLSSNPILAYNWAFLASFVLSGLGTFLLVRSIVTGRPSDRSRRRSAFVAGVIAAVLAAFNPLRLHSDVSSLPLLSSQWIPFALWGVHRYLVTDSRRALALGSAALVGQSVSSFASMAGAAPFALLFVIVEAVRFRRWQLRVWLELWTAAAAVAVVTMQVMLPYLEVQRQLTGRLPSAVFSPSLTLFLAMAVGLAGAAIMSRWTRGGAAVVTGALIVYLGYLRAMPIPIDRPLDSADLASPAAILTPSDRLPAMYREVQGLSSDAVLLELPIGDRGYDLRYMFFAAAHGRRLVNGFGEVLPPGYVARHRVLANPLLDPERTVQALAVATHVIVHRAAWPDDRGAAIARQLAALGGALLAQDGDAVLYQMRATERVTRARHE